MLDKTVLHGKELGHPSGDFNDVRSSIERELD